MFSPTVTELPRRLEAISRDTFNDAVRVPAPGRSRDSHAPLENVVMLRPGARDARSASLAAA